MAVNHFQNTVVTDISAINIYILLDLKVTGPMRDVTAKMIVNASIERYANGVATARHPFPTSQREKNGLGTYLKMRAGLNGEKRIQKKLKN